MPLSAGDRLGPYEILAPIGAGGMGEVYRARDSRLRREVAIKVSAERFSERFEREARAIAALNHPNICTLYDVGPHYLVMEFVEGETLSDRIRQDAIPLTEALSIAHQIADALAAAHEKGVVHRDLKPANIKIKPDGTVKVLDFGLAKMGGEPAAAAGDDSPTLTMGHTEAGVILGTAAYMAPEQAKGKTVDKRADIWAFGVVLFEMLTGERLFRGETVSEVLASVLKDEPNWGKAPAQARLILRRCLEKEPKRRLHDIADAMLLLEEPSTASEISAPAGSSKLAWALAGALAIGLAVSLSAYWRLRQTQPPSQFVQLDIDAGEEVAQPVLSPDGSLLVYVAKNQLMSRRLDQARSVLLAGTNGASYPFFSPDGRWVGFFADGKIKKLPLDGGSAQTIGDIATARGATWTEDGYIIASTLTLGGLFRVPASGGTPQPFTDTRTIRRR